MSDTENGKCNKTYFFRLPPDEINFSDDDDDETNIEQLQDVIENEKKYGIKVKYIHNLNFGNCKRWLLYEDHIHRFDGNWDERDDFTITFDIFYNKNQNLPEFFSFSCYAQPNHVIRAFDELILELTEFLDIDHQSFSDDVKLLIFAKDE
jgi:hypothetical protein